MDTCCQSQPVQLFLLRFELFWRIESHLPLAWATAARNGYVACHGRSENATNNDKKILLSFFGLSGSGKSTLTHAKHGQKYEIKVLHDDAFIIHHDGSSIALEPSYLIKMSDYPSGHREQDFFTTVQNCGVTLEEMGEDVSY